jgi:hypothetical protein
VRIFLATSWRNRDYAAVLARLRAEGFDVYDFKNEATAFHWREVHDDDTPWPAWRIQLALEHDFARRAFAADKAALDAADACVLILPAGASAHSEAGYARGAGKSLRVLNLTGEGEPETVYRLAEGYHATLDDLVAGLREDEGDHCSPCIDGFHADCIGTCACAHDGAEA